MAPLRNCFLASLVMAFTFTSSFTVLSAHRHLLQSTPATQPPALTFPPLPKTTMPPLPSLPNQPQPNLPPMPTQIPSLPNPVQPTIPNLPQVNLPIPSNLPFNLPFNIPNIPFLTPPPSK
ncbi:hypothetical protein EUTSA_v10026588mg [Eutrema salsugineum]|uniref:Uncharacterized protein n=1 Tax=Eutrema salsugineum TaxID=72664 RepID=V4P1Q5_EUTSA|nr:protein PELPK1 [Eutrema salsugineum]ESQ53271.1 hypothetical protein EUTSA_v10026588mg [Eutrema salsugineum]